MTVSAAFVKKAPRVEDPRNYMEDVSKKVKMLENVVLNLTTKFSEETKLLREDSKNIRAELQSLKPTYSDLFKRREGIAPSSGTKATELSAAPPVSGERSRK